APDMARTYFGASVVALEHRPRDPRISALTYGAGAESPALRLKASPGLPFMAVRHNGRGLLGHSTTAKHDIRFRRQGVFWYGFVACKIDHRRNTTGFMVGEYGFGAKWVELLKEIAPGVKRAAVMREAGTAPGSGQFAGIQSVAPSLGVELSPVGVGDVGDMERAVTAFARSPNGGLIVTGSGPATTHRDLIVTLAARHKLPAVYFVRLFVTAGGLISYGPDYLDLSRRTAVYVDRILKGEKPADLPVQAPTKYELVIN